MEGGLEKKGEQVPGSRPEVQEVKDPGGLSLRVGSLLDALMDRDKEKVTAHPKGVEAWNMVTEDLKQMPKAVKDAFRQGAKKLWERHGASYAAGAWSDVAAMELSILSTLTKAKTLAARMEKVRQDTDKKSGGNKEGQYASIYNRVDDSEKELVQILTDGDWDDIDYLARMVDKWTL